jgi:cell division protein FtsW
MGFDQALVWLTLALLAMGLVMVYSATIALPDSPRFAKYTPTFFFTRHLVAIIMAIAVAAVVTQVPMSTWEKTAPWLFVAALVLLILVLIPHIGKVVYGARRWLPLGIMNFQPSELAKLAITLYASDYMVRKMDVKEHFFRAVAPMAVAVGVVGLLLLAEPDMGAFMVIATIAMAILFLGGVNGRMFFLITAVLIGAFTLMVTLSPWRRERIFAYLDPWSEKNLRARRGLWRGPGLQP